MKNQLQLNNILTNKKSGIFIFLYLKCQIFGKWVGCSVSLFLFQSPPFSVIPPKPMCHFCHTFKPVCFFRHTSQPVCFCVILLNQYMFLSVYCPLPSKITVPFLSFPKFNASLVFLSLSFYHFSFL